MKTIHGLVGTVIAALVSFQAAAFAQTDQGTYNSLHSQKTTAASNAQTALQPLYAQRDSINGVKGTDQATVNYYTTVLASDNQNLQSIQGQMNGVYAQMQNDVNAINGDEETIAYLWDLYDYYSEEDPEDGFTLYDIELEVDLMSEDEAQYYADLSFLQPQVDELQSEYDSASAARDYDQAALSSAQAAVTADNNNLAPVQSQISSLEATYNAATNWLNNNPTYSAWIANGYPQ